MAADSAPSPGREPFRAPLSLGSVLPRGLYFPRSTANVIAGRSSATNGLAAANAPAASNRAPKMFIPAPAEKLRMYSPEFYGACIAGGAVACGPTHCAVTPLDMVKVNMQADPKKYKSILQGFSIVRSELGPAGILKGWLPTFVGYSLQGAFKYGGYEYFKHYYSELVGAENAKKYRDLVYLAGSASAEFFADIALCPFEAIKVRVQTQPQYASGMIDGLPKFVATEGFGALYKGLVPLWSRQIPYTMMKFFSFERTIEIMYKTVVPYPKDECSKSTQLGVSFVSGYIAGIFCTLVSQPADNVVSLMNKGGNMSAGQAIAQLGVVGMFTRGLGLRIFQIGTLTGAQWAIYDSVKVIVGLPTTGHVEKEEGK